MVRVHWMNFTVQFCTDVIALSHGSHWLFNLNYYCQDRQYYCLSNVITSLYFLYGI